MSCLSDDVDYCKELWYTDYINQRIGMMQMNTDAYDACKYLISGDPDLREDSNLVEAVLCDPARWLACIQHIDFGDSDDVIEHKLLEHNVFVSNKTDSEGFAMGTFVQSGNTMYTATAITYARIFKEMIDFVL